MRVLEADGMTGYFTEIVTSLYGFPRKPSPEGLHYLIDKYALDRRQCCMVGDRLIDLACGKNAGVSRILFDPDGYMEGLEAEARFARMDDMRAALIGKEG